MKTSGQQRKAKGHTRKDPSARLVELASFVQEALASPSLEPMQRAAYKDRVQRALAELHGEPIGERRALVYDAVRLHAWGDEGWLADVDAWPVGFLDRRVRQTVDWIADVDPALAAQLDHAKVREALVVFATNKGGRSKLAAVGREGAMQALLASTSLGSASMRQIKRRTSPRFKL